MTATITSVNEMLKRYLAFAFDGHHEVGGWNDFLGSYDSVDEAQDAIDAGHIPDDVWPKTEDRIECWDGWQIVDSQTSQVVVDESAY